MFVCFSTPVNGPTVMVLHTEMWTQDSEAAQLKAVHHLLSKSSKQSSATGNRCAGG